MTRQEPEIRESHEPEPVDVKRAVAHARVGAGATGMSYWKALPGRVHTEHRPLLGAATNTTA